MQQNSTYRIRTKVGDDAENVVNVKLDQHYSTFEILSLKINQENFYKTYESDYGVVVGRVLANNGFGVPNAKVSIFIESDDNDDLMSRIYYPYKSPNSKNADGVRYNLLTDYLDKVCYQNVGTFPNKRLVLDNDDVIDIFDKYYRYTTVTNNAGDYMIFGVPTGNQRLHVDVDLSDIGMLSQRPRDMVYKGYNLNLFESPNKFKRDTNLNSLAQIKTQDIGIYVYPYWGDTSEGVDNIAVTRADIQIDYKFEPTCVFMGSIITDTGSNAIGKNCTSTENVGKMSDLIAGEGSIEMIRKTYDGKIEEFQVRGNRVIDGDGVWCYQIPMNLDYIMTDEFGNIVPSDNPQRGIPTRARVRFRISLDDAPSDNTARKRCRYLVPNNPRLDKDSYPEFYETKEVDYEFGSRTRDENFKDLLWNKVYTVKNYIPRLQKNRKVTDRKHTGIKLINHYDSNNPMPYNNVDIKLGFTYRLLCVIFKIFINLVQFLNQVLTALSLGFCVIYKTLMWIAGLFKFPVKFLGWPFRKLAELFEMLIMPCVAISADMCSGNTTHNLTFYPGCGNLMFSGKSAGAAADCIRSKTEKSHKKKEDKKIKDKEMDESERTTPLLGGTEELYNCVETALAEDNDTISLNFQNDWVNGTLYAPMWFRKITKKRRYFFGLIKRSAKDQWCEGEKKYTRKLLRVFNPCSPKRNNGKDYTNFNGETIRPKIMNYSDSKSYSDSCRDKCHESTKAINLDNGLIVKRKTMLGQDVYYYKPVEFGYADQDLIDNVSDFAVGENGGDGSVKILFATDIVLLGSLNDCDIHGVPQFFNSLESTTFQIPPNILFADNEVEVIMSKGASVGGADSDPDNVKVEYQVSENSVSEATGMDWGNFNEDICGKWNDPQDSGLFYSIGCSTIKMKPKSCINMTRICEFGVSLDETKAILNTGSNVTSEDVPSDNVLYDTLVPDGFISKDELYNDDERSLFATLNINGLKTIRNSETGLKEYAFKHVVLNNFDGSLRTYMSERQRKCQKTQKYNYLLEEFCGGYYDFRMGKKPYYYDKENRFPRYENSFYFYFGLNSGKTAIDKFNSQFTSNCLNDNEDMSQIGIETKPNSWCVEMDLDGNYDDSDYGYVAFDFSFIDLPCDVVIRCLSDSTMPEIVINENSVEKIYISKVEQPTLEARGYQRHEISLEYDMDGDSIPLEQLTFLLNGTYELIITDNNGEIMIDEFSISPSHIKSYIVGTDFYESDSALMQKHGNDRNKIIKDKKCLPENNLTVNSTRGIGGTIAISWPTDDKSGDKINNFEILIGEDDDTIVYNVSILVRNGRIESNDNALIGHNENVFIFGVPKGDVVYDVEIRQMCGDNESNNVYTESVLIKEISPYKLYINGTVDYDVIKHWDCGFKVDSVNIENNETEGTATFSNYGEVCDKWWHMSRPENYLWLNYTPYQDIDKEICSLLKVYDTVISNNEINVADLSQGVNTLRQNTKTNKHFLYTIQSPFHENDVDYVCSDVFNEINIENALICLRKDCKLCFIKSFNTTDLDALKRLYASYVLGPSAEDEQITAYIADMDDDSTYEMYYDFVVWVIDSGEVDYASIIQESSGSTDNYDLPAYLDLVDIDKDIIDLIGNVSELKREFINNTKSALQLTCKDTDHQIFFTVETNDKPVTFHGIYKPEEQDETTYEYILDDDYSDNKALYTKDGAYVDSVTIPTITHKESEYADTSKSVNNTLCYAKDANEKHKYCNFIAVINSRGHTKPNDAKFRGSLTEEEKCGISVNNFTDKVIEGNYFGYHIIDKTFENRFMMWSYFDRIPYYKPKVTDSDCFDEDKAGTSICMNGIFASKIFNGNVTEYRDSYVYTGPVPDRVYFTEGDIPNGFGDYYTKYYRNNEYDCDVITETSYENLEVSDKSSYSEVYIRIRYPEKKISKQDYDSLSDNDKANYTLYRETLFDQQQFGSGTLEIYTGRNDGESDADVEDRMPTVRYVTGNTPASQSKPFLNYRVTSVNETYNSELWQITKKQYASVGKRSIDLHLQDENYCMIDDTIDGRMKIVLSSDSINLCSTDNKNHQKNSRFKVELENPNGENVTYFVFAVTTEENDPVDENEIPYPLNYANAVNNCDELLCRDSELDMHWDGSTNEANAVFSHSSPKNLFSYYSDPEFLLGGKTAKIGNAPVRKQLESSMHDENSGEEKTTLGYGNTGVFKMEKHSNPYFVVAITDNNCRAISPVYDFSYVCAKLIFGVVYSKIETFDENGLINGYEYDSSGKMTFDVANAIKKHDAHNGCNKLPVNEGCVKDDDVLYYFYYYPYDIEFEIKLDDVSTITGSYRHGAYKYNPDGYELFQLDEHAYETLLDMYKHSNDKVGNTIRGNTRIIARDYTGLKHDVDWRGCKQSNVSKNYGCGNPYEYKKWVSVVWVTNGGKWSGEDQNQNAYVRSACDEWNNECGYYESEANYMALYTTNDKYKPYDVGKLHKDNCDERQDDDCGLRKSFIGWSTSYDSSDVIDPDKEITISGDINEAQIYYAVWGCDICKVIWKDCNDTQIDMECNVMKGTVITYDEMLEPNIDGMKVKGWTIVGDSGATEIEGVGFEVTGDVTFKAICVEACTVSVTFVNYIDLSGQGITLLYFNATITAPDDTITNRAIMWSPPTAILSPSTGRNSATYNFNGELFEEGTTISIDVTRAENPDGCDIFGDNAGTFEHLCGWVDGLDAMRKSINEVNVTVRNGICQGNEIVVSFFSGSQVDCSQRFNVSWLWGYDHNEDGDIGNDIIRVDHPCRNELVYPPQVSREGYELLTWSVPQGSNYDYTVPVNSDMTFIAKWIKTEPAETIAISFFVKNAELSNYHVNTEPGIRISDLTFPTDVDVTPLLGESERFNGCWSIDGSGTNVCTNSLPDTQITSNTRFNAVIDTIVRHTVTFKNYDGVTISTEQYEDGQTINSVPSSQVIVPAGKTFNDEWSDGNGHIYATSEIIGMTVSSDLTFTAVLNDSLLSARFLWQYPSDVTEDAAGNPLAENVNYSNIVYGTSIYSPTNQTLNGYVFDGWEDSDNSNVIPANTEIVMIKDYLFNGLWSESQTMRYQIKWRLLNYTNKSIQSIGVRLGVSYGSGNEVVVNTSVSAGGGISPYNESTGTPGSHSHSDLTADRLPESWDTLYGFDATMTYFYDGHTYENYTITKAQGLVISHSSRQSGGNYLPYIQSYVGTDTELVIELHDAPEPMPHSLIFKVKEENGDFERTVKTSTKTFVDSYTIVSSDIPSAAQIISYANNGVSGRCTFLNDTTDTITWLNGNSPVNATITGDATFTAVVKYVTHIATFVWGKGNAQNINQTVIHGDYAVAPETIDPSVVPSVTGWTFNGWSPQPSQTPIIAATNFVGQWTEDAVITHTVTFMVEIQDSSPLKRWTIKTLNNVSDGHVLTSAEIPTDSEVLNATDNPAAYEYDGAWKNGSSQLEQPIVSDKTFIALAYDKTFRVTFKPNNGSQNTTTMVNYGEDVVMPQNPTYSGYVFNGWLCNADNLLYSYGDTYESVVQNIEFSAQWRPDTPNTHTVTFVFGLNKPNEVQTVSHGGTAQSPTIPTISGYQFYEWDGDITQPILSDVTFTASWKVRVEFSVSGGTIVGDAVQFVVMDEGHVTVPTVNANSGKRFKDKWVIRGGSTQFSSSTISGWTFDEPYIFDAVMVNIYTVNFYAVDSTHRIGGVHTVEEGNTVTPPTTEQINAVTTSLDNRIYMGKWRLGSNSGTEYENSWFTNNGITSNMDFYAKLGFNVWFDFDQESLVNPSTPMVVEQGRHANQSDFPTPGAVENCTFLNTWLPDPTSTTINNHNTTFVAQWDCEEPTVTHQVTWLKCDGETVFRTDTVPDGFIYSSNSNPSLPTKADVIVTGCLFTGKWDSSKLRISTDSEITDDVTFTPVCSCSSATYEPSIRIVNNTGGVIVLDSFDCNRQDDESVIIGTQTYSYNRSIQNGSMITVQPSVGSFVALEVINVKINVQQSSYTLPSSQFIDDSGYYYVQTIDGNPVPAMTFYEWQKQGRILVITIEKDSMMLNDVDTGAETESE